MTEAVNRVLKQYKVTIPKYIRDSIDIDIQEGTFVKWISNEDKTITLIVEDWKTKV